MGPSAWNHIQTLYEVHMYLNFILSAYAFHSDSHRKHYITCTYQVEVALHKAFLVSTLDDLNGIKSVPHTSQTQDQLCRANYM